MRTFPSLLVTGPRQSGKTTLLRHGWGKTHEFLSLENPDVRARALHDPVGFLRDHPPPEEPAPPFTLGDWLLRGAYPEPRANPEVDRNIWCSSYIQTYLERDVRQILQVGDLNVFERYLRLVAARTGQILNYSDLARDT